MILTIYLIGLVIMLFSCIIMLYAVQSDGQNITLKDFTIAITLTVLSWIGVIFTIIALISMYVEENGWRFDKFWGTVIIKGKEIKKE